jgi:hypothetical protein
MMRNPIEMMVQNMLRQGGGNPQVIAQNIIKRNPQFAQQLQGKNVQELAMNEMRKSGLNPQMFMNNMFGNGR